VFSPFLPFFIHLFLVHTELLESWRQLLGCKGKIFALFFSTIYLKMELNSPRNSFSGGLSNASRFKRGWAGTGLASLLFNSSYERNGATQKSDEGENEWIRIKNESWRANMNCTAKR
jgi:hypothetical protein